MDRARAGQLAAAALVLLAAMVGLFMPTPGWWSRGTPTNPPALAFSALLSAAGLLVLHTLPHSPGRMEP